jgi:predicted ATP-binding protein involved in virulence
VSFQQKTPKHVKDKIRQAKQGDLYSCYTVSDYYFDGEVVEEDLEKSKHYLKKVSKIINNSSFRLKKIELSDYKKFPSLVFNTSKKNTTVIIGNNGSGKSTILESIAKCLHFLSDNIRIKNNNNYRFNDSEINITSKSGYSYINSTVEIKDYLFNCSLAKNSENIPRKISSHLEEFKSLAGMYQKSNDLEDNKLSYPLLAYYPVERSVVMRREDTTKFSESKSSGFDRKTEGLKNSFDGTSNFKEFFIWFKELDDIINEHKAKNSITKEELEAAILKNAEIDDIQALLSKLINNKSNSAEKSKEILIKQQDFVTRSIATFLSNIDNINIKRSPSLDMTVTQDGREISIFNLSQGEKTLISLISDIARRLVILNPDLENPLHGTGIVLIDEIDLHLHPQWQQTIVQKLENTFPNIQFIVSTHSPLVLTTVTSEQIKIINETSGRFEIISPLSNPFGKQSSEALAIMNTSETPKVHNDDIEALINKFEGLVKSGQEELRSTQEIKKRIEKTGYTFEKSDIELWRFIADNNDLFSD